MNSDMTFLQHLSELRKCFIRSLIPIVIFTIVGFNIVDFVVAYLTVPFYTAFPKESVIGTGPAEAFILRLKTAIFTGVLLSLPFIFYQIWKFIAPALYETEKKFIMPFVVLSTLAFFSGVLFCYFAVFPFAFSFFYTEYMSMQIVPQIKVSELLSFEIMTLLAFGTVFNGPVLVYLLAKFGVVTEQMLIKAARPAIVVIFIISAILTPPDVITQFLMAVPLVLLYGISILVVKFTAKR